MKQFYNSLSDKVKAIYLIWLSIHLFLWVFGGLTIKNSFYVGSITIKNHYEGDGYGRDSHYRGLYRTYAETQRQEKPYNNDHYIYPIHYGPVRNYENFSTSKVFFDIEDRYDLPALFFYTVFPLVLYYAVWSFRKDKKPKLD